MRPRFRWLPLLLVLLAFPAAAQSQWCYQGDCVADCPQTVFRLNYDWWWCSCPTSSDCMYDPIQTCNRCRMASLGWCWEDYNPYCATYFLTGYDQFCGCQSAQGECAGPTAARPAGGKR